jgi:hypothetical protein
VGGVPGWEPAPLPMLGQLWVAPEPELEPELPVLVLEDGVVADELDDAPEPEFPVVEDVVAALATNAPPAMKPEVSAHVASTLRRRSFIGCDLSSHCEARPLWAGASHGAPPTCGRAQNDVGALVEMPYSSVTILRKRVRWQPGRSSGDAR